MASNRLDWTGVKYQIIDTISNRLDDHQTIMERRARANILGYILGYFVLLQHHSDIKYRNRISDISRFCSKWVDSPTGYLDISRFCSKWVDLPTGYSDVSRFCYRYRCLVLVQYLRPSSLYQDIDFISGYLADIWRKNIGYFQPWQILNHRIFANP